LLVLAHPNYSFKTQKEFSDYVEYAVKNWITGIEINSLASKDWVEIIQQLAQKHKLIVTFWSDCHFWDKDPRHANFLTKNVHVEQEYIDQQINLLLKKIDK
jgi:hypothetical protein